MKSLRKRTGKGREERDEFLGLADRVRFYIADNSTKAYVGLAVVAGVIVLTVVISVLMSQSRKNQIAMQAEAIAYYDVESRVPGDTPMQNAERYAKAKELFEKITSKHSGGPLAAVSAYYEAGADFELGELDRAIEGYSKLVTASGTDTVLYSVAGMKLASALKEKGDVKGALDVYKELGGKGVMRGAAHFMAGQLYEDTGSNEQAILEYTLIKKEFTGSPWHADALARLEKLQPEAVDVQAMPAAPAEAGN